MFINKNSKIYIVCPAKVKSGGPELLHQLCFKLRELKIDAYMHYYHFDKDHSNPTPVEFLKYNAPFLDQIEDHPDNLVIVPEVRTFLLFDYKHIRKAVWWLSIDNFTRPRKERSIIRKIYHAIFKPNVYHPLSKIQNDKSIINFCQSYYAVNFLERHNFSNIYLLSDYLNSGYFENSVNDASNKKDIIVYNPLKGKEYTAKLRELAPELNWVALQNMTTQQVKEALLQAKVYIDFGEHPGKDRIPREAAVCGCCVITGLRGSSAFKQDVPISDKYKFEDTIANLPLVIETIKECLLNFSIKTKDFESYILAIKKEEQEFDGKIQTYFTPNKIGVK